MRFKKFDALWKRQYCVDEPIEGAGGGGGTSPATQDEKTELERLRSENQNLSQFKTYYENVNNHIEVDASGNVKLKGQAQANDGMTAEEKQAVLLREQEHERTVRDAANAIQASESNKKDAFKHFQDDALFSENSVEAEKFLSGVPVKNRTVEQYTWAYRMAAGSKVKQYQENARKQGREEAMAEFARSGGAAIPKGDAAGKSEEGKEPWRNITLSEDQLRHANMQIKSGWISSIDDYKKAMTAE